MHAKLKAQSKGRYKLRVIAGMFWGLWRTSECFIHTVKERREYYDARKGCLEHRMQELVEQDMNRTACFSKTKFVVMFSVILFPVTGNFL